MANKKLEIKATNEQLEILFNSLKGGAPLELALKRAKISMTTYYYWVAISSIVETAKSQEEIEELEKIAHSGVSIQNVRDIANAENRARKSGVGAFIEPSAESLLQYKNSRKFKRFADEVHDIISNCDTLRADFATLQLLRISQSTQKKNGINPSGAMWWLERNMPDQFAKPSDKAKEEDTTPLTTPPIQVEFIDPGTSENVKRLEEMEKKILNETKGEPA